MTVPVCPVRWFKAAECYIRVKTAPLSGDRKEMAPDEHNPEPAKTCRQNAFP